MNETPEARAARKAGRTGKAFGRAQFIASRLGDFDRSLLDSALGGFMSALPELALLLASGFPANNILRWVPIGPSTVRNATHDLYRRSSGRIKDIAVSDDGRRAYAATATGGVWFTDDAGRTWAPIGGWANRTARLGGPNSAQSCGSILVHFGATAAQDFVMVGTGMGDLVWNRAPNRPALGGLGVLAGINPAATAGVGGDPWEAESGINVLEGLGIFRLARDPSSTAGNTTNPGLDRVAIATSRGLFLGVRAPDGAGGKFVWTEKPALGTFMGLPLASKPIASDVLWLRHGADPNGRIVVAVCLAMDTLTTPAAPGAGVAYSDDLGATFHWVTNLDMTVMAPPAAGRMSFALAEAARVYVVGDLVTGVPGNAAALWQVPDMTISPPVATTVTGMPADIWNQFGGNQRDWDQCVAVDVIPGVTKVDRLYLGGSFKFRPPDKLPGGVWCFDVTPALSLTPAPGISRSGPPPAEGANPAGLIGDNIHADIQRIALTAGAPGNRHVWVACDGGVFVSTQGGRVNTFQPKVTGLGAVEVNFQATHPTSSHYMAIGTQDNGRHMRIGDMVWDETVGGDGGGVTFHEHHSVIVLSQATNGSWTCTPSSGFTHPLRRALGGAAPSREDNLASFYTGAASVRSSASAGRVSLGTNRVWVTDDLTGGATNHWNVLPFPSGAVSDPRPGGTDPVAKQGIGVPGGAPLAAVATQPLGVILTQKWAKPTELLVLFQKGLVRWTQDPVTLQWTARVLVAPAGVVLVPAVVGAPDPALTILSDIGPVPGTSDFYLVTTGDAAAGDTCFFFDDATSTFSPANLRAQLPAVGGLPRGPLDPAYSVVVNPANVSNVYVGTVTGVWQGTRAAGVAAHVWFPLLNGLPQAVIQDLSIFRKAGGPLLLRAAVQARGVWELDIGNGVEPQRTYIKVHLRDDRRQFPTPMDNPRHSLGHLEPTFASPDIVVRPASNPGFAPAWKLGADTIRDGNAPPYQLWTFQTAFRWIFPSVAADGVWTEALGELVKFHRNTLGILPAEPKINQALWNAVVRDTHLDAADAVTANAADPRAVYRAPWTSAGSPSVIPTEVDILDSVVPPSTLLGVQQVFSEPSTVDVLIHHRDTRPLNANDAFVILLMRPAASQAGALAPATIGGIPGYVSSALTAEAVTGGVPSALPADPAGWTLVRNAAGRALHTLNVKLDARMPRAVSINVDLSAPGVPVGNRVLFLVIVGSKVDPCTFAPVAMPATPTMDDLVRRWPYAAMRLIRTTSR